ncbi:MAG TPA: DUF502 domain-containing protein [Nitrospirota bacterium]|nr:DUF502 domain-containing protein [Nitrospirota bacterium]
MKKIKYFFRKYFLTGLLVLLPIWATYYVLSALLSVIDGILGDLPRDLIGLKFPGLGILTLIVVVVAVGMLSANYLGSRIVRLSDELLHKVPLVRGVYFTVKQVMETFSLKQNFHGVALVEYPRRGCYSIGFMTGEVPGEHLKLNGTFVTVFVPTTPNPTAGFLLVLPEPEVIQLDMTVEQGMRFIISLGLVPLRDADVQKMKRSHPKDDTDGLKKRPEISS